MDRVVELRCHDGEIATDTLVLVDDDGVVYDCVRSNREEPRETPVGAAFWATLKEVAEVVVSPAVK